MSATTTAEHGAACLKWGGGTLMLSDSCVIGRRSDNDLQINNVQVSRRHALVVNVNNNWWLNDLHSRNGTLINGRRLNNAHRLRDGDEISIANHLIAFSHPSLPRTGHNAINGEAAQAAPHAWEEGEPPAVTCGLIITTTSGEIIEGETAARWIFDEALERMPGAQNYLLPPKVRQWLSCLDKNPASTPLEFHKSGRRCVITVSKHKENLCFLLVRDESSSAALERLLDIVLTEREAEVMH